MSRPIRWWIWFANPYGADRHRHGTFPSLSLTERTPGYEPGDVRSSRAGKALVYRRMAKLVSHPALNSHREVKDIYKKLLCELDKIEIRDMHKIQERRLTIIRGYKQSQIEK